MSWLVSALSSQSVVIELGVCALVVTWGLRPRPHAVARAALLAVALLVALWIPQYVVELMPAAPGELALVALELSKFVPLFLVLLGAVGALFDVRPWGALFCATAGYTIQNLVGALLSLARLVAPPLKALLMEGTTPLLITLLLCAACSALFRRGIRAQCLAVARGRSLLLLFALVVPVAMCFDLVIREIEATGASQLQMVSLRLFHIATCAFLLWQERSVLRVAELSDECADAQRLIDLAACHESTSEEALEAASACCHDMRHLLDDLKSLDTAAGRELIDELDERTTNLCSQVRTGNDTLDALLGEKLLKCHDAGISLSCMVDGKALGNLSPLDLYSLIGNALDNAIEAVSELTQDRRSISLTARKVGSMVAVHVENYFEGDVIVRKDGLLKSSKSSPTGHGHGMRSMRLVAEKYHGSLAYEARDGVFKLSVLLPAA